ncbi:MAG: hypothetical protein IGS38_05615 [Synechococcales cyanobacterium M58_A2018_015]|nr:hypothetical protein [Synechococcales cyanobacterium M58_A2018_015]
MSNSMKKDQLTADLEKAKAVGSARLERVRDILRDAISQVMVEVKAGTGELRSIAQESASTMQQPSNHVAANPDVVPVEVVIADGVEDSEPTPEIAQDATQTSDVKSDETVVESLISPVSPAADELSKPQIAIVDNPMADAPGVLEPDATAETEPSRDAGTAADAAPLTNAELVPHTAEPTKEEAFLESWMQQLLRFLQDSEVGAKLQQQGSKLQERLVQIDSTLSERYGDRYAAVKQEVSHAKDWYNAKRAEITARGIDPVQQKQAEYDVKAGEAGATIARKEQEIKRLLKELWQTITR